MSMTIISLLQLSNIDCDDSINNIMLPQCYNLQDMKPVKQT